MIFLPDLSTSSRVTDISGQGVGMDAVRCYLEQSGGSIFLELFEADADDDLVPFAFHILLPTHLYAPITLKRVA